MLFRSSKGPRAAVAHKPVTEGSPDLPRKTSLIQRAGHWYFNRAYPKDLWPILGKAPFRLSLQTDSFEVALRRRPDAERRYFAALDKARDSLGKRTPRQMSEIEATAIAIRWFKDEDAFRSAELEDRRGMLFDIDDYLQELASYEADARQAIAENDLHVVRQDATRLVAEQGFEVQPQSRAFKALQRAMLRGRRELTVLQRERLLGNYGVKPSDPIFVAGLASPPARIERTIDDLIEGHRADKVASRAPSTQAS